eukprot:TRINITY_DN1778_c0_g1_i2.p1 TRINITY_DN1778_c0_g1~~TRINITY_DN1778_c0_g1_i2.p1  ORF type:complete len:137 (-),score=25.26 TRINITY_DN1778_c0_g1_i2:36-386(-)
MSQKSAKTKQKASPEVVEAETEQPVETKKRKKPESEKKFPASAFLLWSEKVGRNAIEAEFPGLPFGEKAKRVGALWNETNKELWERKFAKTAIKAILRRAETRAGSKEDASEDEDS